MTETADAKHWNEPFELFARVFSDANKTGMENPDAMVVSSVGEGGRVSSRVVLLKHFDEQGFVFYTNLESDKGREIIAHPAVALNFYWRQLEKQIVIIGTAQLVPDEEADRYFESRPRMSQLGAWASQQSRKLPSKKTLIAEMAKLEVRYLGRRVSRPPHWGGFRVVPDHFEFWTAGRFRLHDRTVYERTDQGWKSFLLYP